MTIDDRWNLIKSPKICANCLRKGHFPNSCPSNFTCKSCQKRHHTSLHRFYPINSNVYNSVRQNSNSFANTAARSENLVEARDNIQLSTTCQQNFKSEEHTLLSTALIKVKNAKGHFVNCRALIDNGSHKSLVSKNCVKRLQLSKTVTNHSISGINNTLVKSSLSEVSLVFSPHFNEKNFCCKALIVDCITSDLPNFTFSSCNWPHLHGLMLADPTFHATGPIDILLGADLYADLLIGEPILGKKGTPAALNSHLGWLLSGRVFSNSNKENSFVNCHLTSSLDCQLAKFWELESLPQAELKSKNDIDCEAFYEKTVARDPSGRYIVRIPFKHSIEFGDSATQASKRFNYIERKLSKNNELEHQYTTFMSEYLQLGHMERVPSDELIKESTFYLPHHFVIKEDSNTTKLRVVFDASAKDSSGNSLNNALHAGPRLQPELFSLLLKFRTFKVAFTADIEKMFRQIRIHEEDTDYQRILWRFKPDEEIQIYRLLTVTYGTACAPYLTVKTLQQLAKDKEKAFPDASRVLKEEFYVDDLLSGTDSIPNAKNLVSNLKSLLQRGGFNLRKWSSNCLEVLSDLSKDSLAQQHNVTIEGNQCQKVLGLYWNTQQDTFQAKKQALKEIAIQRRLVSVNNIIIDAQLHGFCDASLKAYSAVFYLKVVDNENRASVNIVAAKTRVAPLKTVSLPRLELCAAHLLAKLYSNLQISIDQFWKQVFLWSDSEIVLSWIRSDSLKDQFVKNRVAAITSLNIGDWNHVAGVTNPADCASRGIFTKKLMDLQLWWQGPEWLSNANSAFTEEVKPNSVHTPNPDTLIHASAVESNSMQELTQKYSSFSKLIRVIAWCKRFVFNSRNSGNRINGCLQVCELDNAPIAIIKEIQRAEFSAEIKLSTWNLSDLSTETFLASFRRFIARRGLPSGVYSDNATNFKGASNYLKSLYKIVRDNSVQDFSSNLQISWHYIPPATPHFGGLWESNIKSTKRHLLKVCGSAILNFEELATLLCQIDACLNSRPLCPLTSEISDLEALTPGHFIVGAPLLSLPERDPSPSMCLKSRWSLIQKLRAQFWNKWSKDYLQTLQTKSKWTGTSTNVAVGDLVLLKTDSISTPLKWTSARIEIFSFQKLAGATAREGPRPMCPPQFS
nr:uncharacterized protein LOC122269090 [Parasteatoda tepidariorum]